MKIVINRCFGDFSLSKDFFEYYNIPYEEFYGTYYGKEVWAEEPRKDPRLIEYIEKFGPKAASGKNSSLKIVEIPKGTKYFIDVYDGFEIVKTENNITWRIAD